MEFIEATAGMRGSKAYYVSSTVFFSLDRLDAYAIRYNLRGRHYRQPWFPRLTTIIAQL